MDKASLKADTLPKKNSKPSQTLKTINYRKGLIAFNTPNNWVEDVGEDGGGIYYEDTPNSGTLRVNVLTLKNKQGAGNPLEVFKGGQKRIDQKEYTTPNGDEIIEYLDRTKENDVPITMFSLVCAHRTNQKDYLLAIFTWTIESRFENQEKYIEEWNMVRTLLQNVKFGQ